MRFWNKTVSDSSLRIAHGVVAGMLPRLKTLPVRECFSDFMLENAERFPEMIWGLPDNCDEDVLGVYNLGNDTIHISDRLTDIGIAQTTSHELVHSTAQKSRLNFAQDLIGVWRSNFKADNLIQKQGEELSFELSNIMWYEESVAEIGGILLMLEVCDCFFEKSVLYGINRIRKHLHEEAIRRSVLDAEEAVNWLLGGE